MFKTDKYSPSLPFQNLFAYGDEDGKGTNAKLQHPLAISLMSDEGPLIVADSYNHKVNIRTI